ncbi:translation initiation factor IF-2-like [Hemicordylus capensis]|uniref:translation initiation factor IF-2-like n=1 Tax=Hemicordylus capensis TaxID=884348 RepID=UPI0023041AB3|nr:translation initiation factor IF-2-like [Hemicordylus capensis]
MARSGRLPLRRRLRPLAGGGGGGDWPPCAGERQQRRRKSERLREEEEGEEEEEPAPTGLPGGGSAPQVGGAARARAGGVGRAKERQDPWPGGGPSAQGVEVRPLPSGDPQPTPPPAPEGRESREPRASAEGARAPGAWMGPSPRLGLAGGGGEREAVPARSAEGGRAAHQLAEEVGGDSGAPSGGLPAWLSPHNNPVKQQARRGEECLAPSRIQQGFHPGRVSKEGWKRPAPETPEGRRCRALRLPGPREAAFCQKWRFSGLRRGGEQPALSSPAAPLPGLSPSGSAALLLAGGPWGAASRRRSEGPSRGTSLANRFGGARGRTRPSRAANQARVRGLRRSTDRPRRPPAFAPERLQGRRGCCRASAFGLHAPRPAAARISPHRRRRTHRQSSGSPSLPWTRADLCEATFVLRRTRDRGRLPRHRPPPRRSG